jgi:predicted permease
VRQLAERLYAAALWLYPAGFRRAHGPEMRQFARTAFARRDRGVIRLLAADTARGLAREWTANLRGEHVRNLFRDLHHGARLLSRNPLFTASAVLTLALGIGANTAMFTLADATLLRPLQVRDAGQLVVWSWSSSYPDYQEYTRSTDVFDGVAAVAGGGRLNLVVDGQSDLTPALFVTGNAFDLFGVTAAQGRLILPADDVPNGPLVGVLGYDYWQKRFGGDPAIVGRTLRANGRPVTILGVVQKGFRGISLGSNPSLYIPVAVSGQVRTGFFARANALTARGLVWLNVVGRLRPGVTISTAAEKMTAVYVKFHPREPGEKGEMLELERLPTRALGRSPGDVRKFVALLMAVVGLTLLIGCANLANLLLAKAATRRVELGVRLALGATRSRVVRLMLAESVLLAIAGGIAGIAIAALTLRMLSTYQLPGGMAIENLRLDLDGAALAVTFALSLVTGLVFGAFPAWRASRTDVLVSLRAESRSATSRSATRGVLLGAQVALSLVLLAGAGLFARSLLSALQSPLGLTAEGLVTASVNVGLARYDEPRAAQYYSNALERVKALPQVQSAAWAGMIPTRNSWVNQTTIEGYKEPSGEPVTITMSHAGPGYFRTVGTRILSGREFAETDTAAAQPVAVINDAMARKYWAGRNAIGGRLQMGEIWITVVGIVENTITQQFKEDPVPFAYLAFNQSLSGKESIATDPAHLFVRPRGDASAAIAAVREQMQSIDPELPVYDVELFEERVRALLLPQRMGVALFSLFSALALALAAVGIYGVASYVAASRTREIGVRIALGATRGGVRRMILLQGMRPVAVGITVGLGLAVYSSRAASAFLFNISPADPMTFTSVTLLLALVALAAIYLPARRASRIEPAAALRAD